MTSIVGVGKQRSVLNLARVVEKFFQKTGALLRRLVDSIDVTITN